MVSQRRKGEHYGRSVHCTTGVAESGQREEQTTGGGDYSRSGQQEEWTARRTVGGADS